jgi:hypothetical protein
LSSSNNPTGHLIGTATSTTDRRVFVNGSQSGSTATTTSSVALDSRSLFVFARNSALTNDFKYSSPRLGAYSIGAGLSVSQASAFYTAMQAFQTALFRDRASSDPAFSAVTNAEAKLWIDNVYANGGTVSTATANAVNTFCNDIDAAGIRDRFYRLNLFAGDSISAALVPLFRGPSRTGTQYGNTTDTNNNFVAGDFNNTGSSAGLKGNGSTKFLNTGYPLNTLAASNAHMAAGLLATQSSVSADRSLLAAYSTVGQKVWAVDAKRPTSVSAEYRRGMTMGSYNVGVTVYFGDEVHTTSLAIGNIINTDGKQYRNGSTSGIAAVRQIQDYPAAHSCYVFAANNGDGAGASVAHTDSRLGSYSLGALLTASQALAYSNALNAFNTSLSRT